MTLYRPDAFEPLTHTPWSEERARADIRKIVADVEAAYRGPKLFWRAHDWDRWHGTSPMKNLYVGTAGVLWALWRLERFGYSQTSLDLKDLAARNVGLFRERPDYIKGMKLPSPREGGLFLGEVGVLLTAIRLGNDQYDDDLYRLVRANMQNEAEELFWGAPGTLLAAEAMFKWRNDDRWRTVRDETLDALLARRDAQGYWTQRLYGQEYRSLTPAHGLVGNVHAITRVMGFDNDVTFKAADILRETAVVEDGLANWPPRPRPELPGPDGQIRVQWCAGSPGIVLAALGYLDEELFLAGAELPWRTGPPNLDKGPGICHGTAGNGYAFLAAYGRTGGLPLWRDRARAFAMHALEQIDRLPPRYSLFTGSLGVALYVSDCIQGWYAYPVLQDSY
jgi:hypothetical protein